MVILEREAKTHIHEGVVNGMFAVWGKSRNPFAMILVPLERGGLRRHFELLSVEIHRRSSEKSSLEVGQVVIFWTLDSLKNVHKRCTLKKHSYITVYFKYVESGDFRCHLAGRNI